MTLSQLPYIEIDTTQIAQEEKQLSIEHPLKAKVKRHEIKGIGQEFFLLAKKWLYIMEAKL